MSKLFFWLLLLGLLYFFWEGAKKTYDYAVEKWIVPEIEQREEQMGAEMIASFLRGEKQVKGTLANKCLDSIKNRLEGQNGVKVNLYLVEQSEVNAFAMMGNHIVVYSGLVQHCKNAEAVAGVLAHEMGHVYLHHVRAKVLKDIGIGVAVSIFFGDMDGFLASVVHHLGSTAFDREQEAEADVYSSELLKRREIALTPLVAFFQDLAKKEGNLMKKATILSTHPDSEQRALKIQEFIRENAYASHSVLHTPWKEVQKSIVLKP